MFPYPIFLHKYCFYPMDLLSYTLASMKICYSFTLLLLPIIYHTEYGQNLTYSVLCPENTHFLIHFSQVNSFFNSISCQVASFVSEEKNVLRRLQLPFFLFSFTCGVFSYVLSKLFSVLFFWKNTVIIPS